MERPPNSAQMLSHGLHHFVVVALCCKDFHSSEHANPLVEFAHVPDLVWVGHGKPRVELKMVVQNGTLVTAGKSGAEVCSGCDGSGSKGSWSCERL